MPTSFTMALTSSSNSSTGSGGNWSTLKHSSFRRLVATFLSITTATNRIANCAASEAGTLPLFVSPGGGSGWREGGSGYRGLSGAVTGNGAAACGSSEEDACPDIRSALLAIPESMPEGTSPELRLLPGLYAGDKNVFLGGLEDTDYPSAARNVSLVGWISSTRDATSASRIGTNNAAVLSCEGRQSRNASSTETRGLWLSDGRITSLANLTVTDCPAGGVGVDLWSRKDPSLSPASLSFVNLLGNGGEGCEKGGGLLVTATGDGISMSEEAVGTQGARGGGKSRLMTVSGCVVANNTAQLGGGIAVDSSSPASRPLAYPVTVAEAVEIIPPLIPGTPGRTKEHAKRAEDLPVDIARGQRVADTLEQTQTQESMWYGGGQLGIVIDEATVVSGNRATFGGGIWASGASIVVVGGEVEVRGNVAGGLREGCEDDAKGSCGGRGGGMFVDGGSLYLRGVSFRENRAEARQARDEYARGGGLSASGSSVDASGCDFIGNSATALMAAAAGIGGGAYLDASNATLRECRFERNRAEGSDLFGQLSSFGGGLATRSPSLLANISDSYFVDNAVGRGGSGGGIWVEDGARVTLDNTNLVNNTASSSYTHKGSGGGVAVSASAYLEVSEGCVLEGNIAGPEEVGPSDPACLSGEGGAIYSSGSGITMSGVTLRGNRCETGALDAGCSGGAISVTGRGHSPAAKATGATGPDEGGANFNGCSFEGNQAKGSASNSVYSGAGQGGAAAIRFAFPTFTACNFTENSAGGGGGAAPATGGAVLLFLARGSDVEDGGSHSPPTFVDCVFKDNRAGSVNAIAGGGGGSAAQEGSRVSRERDEGHGIGGALAAIASSPLLSGCAFVNNTAVAVFPSSSGGGGGGGGKAPVTSASPSFGGAILLTSDCSGTRLNDCTLDGNAARNGVGGDLAVLAAPSAGRSASVTSFGGASAAAVAETLSASSTFQTARKKAVSETPYSSAAAAVATVVLSGCTFRPAPAQSGPTLPWANGRSETKESPFLFVLDGGTVELVSPVFEAAGQAFVAQVDPDFNSDNDGGGSTHLRIIEDGVSRAPGSPSSTMTNTGGGGGRGGRHDRRSASGMAMLSVVSVGGKVSLVDERGGAGSSRGDIAASPGGAERLPSTPPFALEDLVLLRGELVLQHSGGDSSGGGSRQAVTVTNSARVRMAHISAAASGTVGDNPGGAQGERRNNGRHYPRGSSLSSSTAIAAATARAATVRGSSVGGVSPVIAAIAGEAKIGEAWEPKPFFLGTSLSQIFPPPPSASDGAAEAGAVYGWRSGGFREGEDIVTFDSVLVELVGQSMVRGEVALAGSAMIQVEREGTLTLAGDASISRGTAQLVANAPSGDVNPSSPAAPTPPVLRNAGVLSFPRGFSLTLDGGIEQVSSGSSLVALASPLYLPPPPVSNGDGWRVDWVEGGWGMHPLVVRSGVVKLGGAVNASTSRRGGESERVKMNRKWALIRFVTEEAASGAEIGSLAVRGPPGVSMEMSMQPVFNGTFGTATGVGSGGGAGWEEGSLSEREDVENQWELVVEAAFIECGSMLAYANVSSAGGPCQACLLNIECSWCPGEGGMGCVPVEDRPIKRAGGRMGEGSCQVGSCCPLGCNGVGECDFFSATCSCPWLYAGTSCAELSTKGAVALSLSLSALLLLLLTLACGRSSRQKQMEAVVGTLQELKRGLLSDAEGSLNDDDSSVTSFGGRRRAFSIGGRGQLPGGGGGGAGGGSASGGASGLSYQHMWPRDYIQDLQQNLALRDVMVAFSELEVSHKIGSGAAGSVWRGAWRGAAVAVKVIRRPFHQAVELSGRDLEVFKREAYLMTRLRHPNIVLIMGVTFAPPGHRMTLDGQGSVSISKRRELGFENAGAAQGSLCIVTELLSRGSLEDVIREGGLRTASYGLILNLALQAARGMLYLHTHSPPIVHRDLKSSNLVVDEHWHVKVTDFGMSRFVPEPIPAIAASSSPANSSASPASPEFPGRAWPARALSLTVSPFSPAPAADRDNSPGSRHPLAMPGRGALEEKTDTRSSSDETENEGELTGVSGGSTDETRGRNDGSSWGLRGAVRWARGFGASGPLAAGGVSPVGREETTQGGGKGELGLTTNLGTVAWAAPEMLLSGEGGKGEYTSKVDIYSFGVVLWELWERRRPFEDLRSRFDIADTVAAGGRPIIGRGCPPPFAELIRRCWHQDPARRPFFQDIVEDLETELGSVESLTEL